MGLLERLDELPRPSPMTMFTGVLITYFLVTAGVAFDIIQEPPGMGAIPDPVTGKYRAQAILPYRINGQYIVEGLVGGFLYTLGGLSIVALDRSRGKDVSVEGRTFLMYLGIACISIAYMGVRIMLGFKMPSYLRE